MVAYSQGNDRGGTSIVGSTIEKIMNKSIKKSLSILSDLFYK